MNRKERRRQKKNTSHNQVNSSLLDAIQKTMPNGWYKQVLWERVMWLDENGNLKMY